MKTTPITTLQEAKDWLNNNYEDGCICPACKGKVVLYKRKLNSGMAYELIRLYQMSNNTLDLYFHHSKFATVSGGEVSKLKYWGLVEEQKKTNEDDKKKTSGHWKITEKGKKFVTNRASLPSHIHLIMNKFVGFSDKQIAITEALGNKFDYYELMRG